jgi:hypothetical protein
MLQLQQQQQLNITVERAMAKRSGDAPLVNSTAGGGKQTRTAAATAAAVPLSSTKPKTRRNSSNHTAKVPTVPVIKSKRLAASLHVPAY